MSDATSPRAWLIGGVGLAVGLLVGYLAGLQNVHLNPQERSLDADLWLQTSGEFRACCLQTYRLAGERLKTKLGALTTKNPPPAVIMDLDETVLDNSPFQTWLYRVEEVYADELWERWEKDCFAEVLAVPGALAFIADAERAGVTVVYISNRLDRLRESTIKCLEHLRINTRGIEDRLLLRTDVSDQTARRKKTTDRFNVLMLFGDNLRDFSEEFKSPKVQADNVKELKAAIQERLDKVDRRRQRFGDDWIILPNPVYGEWTALEGSRPVEVLHQAKGMK